MNNLAHNLSYNDEGHLEHTSTLKHTSKGLRIWIENSTFLNTCGFSVGKKIGNSIDSSRYDLVRATFFTKLSAPKFPNTIDKVIIIEGIQS